MKTKILSRLSSEITRCSRKNRNGLHISAIINKEVDCMFLEKLNLLNTILKVTPKKEVVSELKSLRKGVKKENKVKHSGANALFIYINKSANLRFLKSLKRITKK
jgi:hypothetical protein